MELLSFIILDLFSYSLWIIFPTKVLTLKKNKKWLIIAMIAINLVQSILVRTIPEFYSNPIKSLMYSAEYAIYIYLAFKEPLNQKIIAYIFFLLSITGADIAVMGLLSLFGYDYTDYLFGVSLLFIGGILCTIFSYFLMLVFSVVYSKIKNKRITNKMWQFQIIILSQFLFIVVTIFSNFKNKNTITELITQNPQYGVMVIITIIIAVIGDICVYKILMTNSQNFELKSQLEVMRTKNELELEYYEKLKNNIAETRKLNHDFSNILAVVESMVTTGNSDNNQNLALDIIAEIKETLSKSKVKYFCENELVNLIVINKSEEIEQTGADFSANLYIPQNIGVNNLDLCRIFTNLLDNAKEACQNAKNKQNTFVVLSANINQNSLIITCENYCDSQIKSKREKLISTKENHKGLGTEIMNEIAESYDGIFSYSFNNAVFTTSISLTLK